MSVSWLATILTFGAATALSEGYALAQDAPEPLDATVQPTAEDNEQGALPAASDADDIAAEVAPQTAIPNISPDSQSVRQGKSPRYSPFDSQIPPVLFNPAMQNPAVPAQVEKRPAQTAVVRLGKRLRDPINAWIAGQSLIGDDPVVSASVLPGLEQLQRHWPVIREEIAPLLASRDQIPALGDISPDHRRIAPGKKWKSLFLLGYGFRSDANCEQCPKTVELISTVPGVVVAFFSILEPGTYVPLHRGLTKAWLNCHLPLAVPTGPQRCAIEIAGTSYEWHEGEWLVFDDTNRHQVWNESADPRVVLFLQVQRPMRLPGRIAARALIAIIRRTSFVQDIKVQVGAR